MEINCNSVLFRELCFIANGGRLSKFDFLSLNEIQQGQQLAYTLGVTVFGLESFESEIKAVNPNFTFWKLYTKDDWLRQLWEIDSFGQGDYNLVKEFKRQFAEAKKLLSDYTH